MAYLFPVVARISDSGFENLILPPDLTQPALRLFSSWFWLILYVVTGQQSYGSAVPSSTIGRAYNHGRFVISEVSVTHVSLALGFLRFGSRLDPACNATLWPLPKRRLYSGSAHWTRLSCPILLSFFSIVRYPSNVGCKIMNVLPNMVGLSEGI
jgi:hypothetical protein